MAVVLLVLDCRVVVLTEVKVYTLVYKVNVVFETVRNSVKLKSKKLESVHRYRLL